MNLSGVAPADLFAVLILWGTDQRKPWSGWLTTVGHRSVAFSTTDIADPRFASWLSDLPGWNPLKLSHALTTPGFHLVWRRTE